MASSSLRCGPPLPARSRRTAFKYTARHPPGPGPVTDRPHVPSGSGRLGYRRSPPGSGRLRPAPGVILVRLRPTRITGRAHGSGRLGPSVQPRHMTPATAASPDPGLALPRACSPRSDRCQWYNVPRCGPACRKEYVAATTARTSWTSLQALQPSKGGQPQDVSRIHRRPLFGTQCRPVGGPAGFEPHRHRTASCPVTRARA
jgi:hypothetical protein